MIYVDLDGTLIHADEDLRAGRVGPIRVRPGATTFLYKIVEFGPVVLLTQATSPHAANGLRAIGRAAEVFDWVLTRKDLQPVQDQIEAIESTPGLRERDRQRLYRRIMPIAPPGYMIDDFPVGSWMYHLKSSALGIGPREWIQISTYDPARTNGSALLAAYRELVERMEHKRYR